MIPTHQLLGEFGMNSVAWALKQSSSGHCSATQKCSLFWASLDMLSKPGPTSTLIGIGVRDKRHFSYC